MANTRPFAPPKVKRKSCLVIGAGLSGLSAAFYLTKAGWQVTVLEAEQWTGGRVFSFRFDEAPELICELGGEWIGADHDHMMRLCQEFKLNLLTHRFDFAFFENGKLSQRYRAGYWPFPESDFAKFNQLIEESDDWNREQQMTFDKKDWWTILRDRGFSEEELLRRDLMDSTDFGESIRMVGGYSAGAEYFDSNRYDEMDFKIEGGNGSLVNAIANAIEAAGGKILHGKKVVSIDQTDAASGVTIRTNDESIFRARYCICTVSARQLTRIQFRPPLPNKHWDAAKQLQYCRIMKTAILCEKRFWMENPSTKFSCFTVATSDFIFDATLDQPGERGILCSYAVGDKADDLWGYSDDQLQDKLRKDLEIIFPSAAPINILKIRKQAWHHTPVEGAYAFYRPGQWFTIRRILRTRVKNVHFAGEHVADDQGFMEGALDTGLDAANRVMKAGRSRR